MKTLLSTKKLKLNQRELILNAGFSFVEYDAIEITFLKFITDKNIENAIFTSQNGVLAVDFSKTILTSCFCVGEKTKALLEEKGQKVIKIGKNSSELAKIIIKKYKKSTFHYFCGNSRREELPELLNTSKINLFEVKTYETSLKLKKFDQKWDGILFFSPSGVASYVSENNIDQSIAFCIGKTTASEAKKHTKNVIVANSTSIESVIAKAVKTLKNYD